MGKNLIGSELKWKVPITRFYRNGTYMIASVTNLGEEGIIEKLALSEEKTTSS